MACQTLKQLMGEVRPPQLTGAIAAHIRTCPHCAEGLADLARALLPPSRGCEVYQARFADYYEASRPDYSLVQLSDRDVSEVALHLALCHACSQEYTALCKLWTQEEREQLE